MRISSNTTGGKVILSLFLALFAGIGCIAAFAILLSLYRSAVPYFWERAECTVQQVNLTESEEGESKSYQVRIGFSCEHEDRTYRHAQTRDFTDISEAQEMRDQFAPDTPIAAYVDPDNPASAVAIRDSFWSAFWLLIPLVFLVVGIGGIYLVWAGGSSRQGAASISARAPQKLKQAGAKIGMSLFFGVFLIAGLAVLYLLALGPLIGIFRARSWVETPCTIISSEVQSIRGDDGYTYKPNIMYEYVFNGREYKSNRYDFSTGSTSDHEPKQRIVDRYPPGSNSVCYVNPKRPAQTVLNRKPTANLWWGLISLPFILAGAGGLLFLRPGTSVRRKSQSPPRLDHRFEGHRGPVELKAKASPMGKFLLTVFIALFWNGITGLFVWKAVESWMKGSPDGCLTLFVIPFALIGLLLIYAVVHQFLALFNPRPVLHLSSTLVCPGDSIDVEWKFTGRVSALSALSIQLKGSEEATYRRGTTTHTDKNIFRIIEIVKTTEPYRIKEGRTQIRIPEDTMHSLKSSNNKITWSVHLSGEIPKWPDVAEEFAIEVAPIPLEKMRR